MKTIRTTIVSIIAATIVTLITSCGGQTASEATPKETAHSYCIALDLSDRIADENTVEKDMASIMQVFDSFEKNVKRSRYMKSQDRFCVVLVPQNLQRNAQELNDIVCELSIDMRTIPVKKRYESFQDFKQKLKDRLCRVYEFAKQPTLKEYSGCNVWSFLSNQLPELLEASSGMDVKLVLLTDCYIEIDNKLEIFERNGQTNHLNSNVMARLRRNDFWQKDPCDILLLPERLCNRDLSQLSVVVAGLVARNTYPYEIQLLEKVWGSFLSRMALDYRIVSYSNGTAIVSQNLSDALI